MKILNVIQCTNLGGMERTNLLMLAGLQHFGHSCELLSLNPIGALGPLLEQNRIPAQGLPYRGRGGWGSVWRFRRELQKSQADALIMTGHNLLAMMNLGNLAKGRRVLTIHYHHEGVKPRIFWRSFYTIATHKFQAITFPSDFIRLEAEAVCPAVSSISHTVRYPFDIPPLPTTADRLAARRTLGLPPTAAIIGNAGWLVPRKRFDVFLRVGAEIAKQLDDIALVIAGGGPEEHALRELSRELGIADKVRWLGWRQDLSIFYKSLDVLVFNSDADALPRTPQEASSYGVPIVASVLRGGLTEIIDQDRGGPVLDTHNIEVLAEKTLELLRHPGRARQTGLWGRQHLAKLASIEGHAERILALLQIDR